MGATTSMKGQTAEEVVKKLQEAIQKTFPNLLPDSNIAVYQPSTGARKLFKVILEGPDEEIEVKIVEVSVTTPVNSATLCAVAIMANYGDQPVKDEWIGCVHFH
jgi:hypothetical protein